MNLQPICYVWMLRNEEIIQFFWVVVGCLGWIITKFCYAMYEDDFRLAWKKLLSDVAIATWTWNWVSKASNPVGIGVPYNLSNNTYSDDRTILE